MANYYLKYFLFYFLFLIKQYNSIKVTQTVLEQSTYYETDNSPIYGNFIDFSTLKFYTINMTRIHYTEVEPNFQFYYNDKEKLSIKCKEDKDKRIKCNEINLDEHQSISFNYDYLIAQTGGVISFFLILYGIFSLLKGYIYYNLTVFFYSSFSLILFWREFCEFLEMIEKLNADNNKSETFLIAFYSISIIASVIFGYVSFLTKYLRYISFGFIDGLIVSKFLFYFIIKALETQVELKYFLAELICCLIFIIFLFLFKDKNPNITMVNISVMASYGIIYGLHVLFGGLPFIPFLILSITKKSDNPKEQLFTTLTEKNNLIVYVIIYILLVLFGCYFNITGYKIFTEKTKKKIFV